jgi:hypothetical protein
MGLGVGLSSSYSWAHPIPQISLIRSPKHSTTSAFVAVVITEQSTLGPSSQPTKQSAVPITSRSMSIAIKDHCKGMSLIFSA